MTYTTSLEVSKLIKEKGIEMESEKYWQEYPKEGEGIRLVIGRHYYFNGIETPSYSLSELASIFKELGKKLGWWDIYDRYENLVGIWFRTQSQERCDNFIKEILTQ